MASPHGEHSAEVEMIAGLVMKILAVENALRWMLAAWMLLATTFPSSTLSHSHFEGDDHHEHGPSDCISVAFVPGADRGGHHGEMSLAGADHHRHRFLLLLETVEHLPMPSEPASSQEKSPCGWDTIIAVSAAPGIRGHSHGLAVDHSRVASLANRSADCICQSGQREIPSSSAALGSLLCDRARHERSGVQLA